MAARFAPAIDALDRALRRPGPLRSWLRSRRWCGESLGPRTAVRISDRVLLAESDAEVIVLFLSVLRRGHASRPLHLPLSLSTVRQEDSAFELSVGSDLFYVVEAERREAYGRFLAAGFERRAKIRTAADDQLTFRGESLGHFRSLSPSPGDDTSNVVVRLATDRGDVVFKSYKLLDVGNREPRSLKRLNARGFPHVPPFLGELGLGRGGDRVVLGLATEHVEAPDLFTFLTRGWRGELGISGAMADSKFERETLDIAAALGQVTAGLHEALTDRHPGPFRLEPFERSDAADARRAALENLASGVRRLRTMTAGDATVQPDLTRHARTLLLENRGRIERTLRGLDASVGTPKGMTHGDLHLAQVLRRASDGGLFIVDFEGEPERPGGSRSAKVPPLRDVASMARSFSYVKHYAWREFAGGGSSAALRLLETDLPPQAKRLVAWDDAAAGRFIGTYLARSHLYCNAAPTEAAQALRGWMMEKALYELVYELRHRPANVPIPLEGILSLAAAPSSGIAI